MQEVRGRTSRIPEQETIVKSMWAWVKGTKSLSNEHFCEYIHYHFY